jgi:hypothetical protein
MPTLKSLVPGADDLLSLDVEDLAGVLLTHLNSSDSGNPAVQHNGIIQYSFFNNLRAYPEFPGRQDEVNRALMEAWNWLEGEGLLVRDAGHRYNESFFLSRRAQRLRTREGLGAYRTATHTPLTKISKHSIVAVAAAISVLLIVSFSTKPPWTQPPTAGTSVHEQPMLQVRPQDRALGFVDRIVASQEPPGSGNLSLEAHGWAVSCLPAVSLASVILLVDGKPVGETKSFSSRPDVAAAYGRSDFESSGWNISSVGSLLPGYHSVTLRAVLANGESILIPGPTLTVN